MADSLEITAGPGKLEIILDGHRIKGVTEYSIEHQSKKPPLLTLKVLITGSTLCRVSGEDPEAQVIRLGLEDVLRDWTSTIHDKSEDSED